MFALDVKDISKLFPHFPPHGLRYILHEHLFPSTFRHTFAGFLFPARLALGGHKKKVVLGGAHYEQTR